MKKNKINARTVKGVYLLPSTIELLKKEADKERRSLSGQMSFILEAWEKEENGKNLR